MGGPVLPSRRERVGADTLTAIERVVAAKLAAGDAVVVFTAKQAWALVSEVRAHRVACRR